MGYAKRKEIFDNCTKLPIAPHPCDSRFELPKNLCPLVSTKHRKSPSVAIGQYAPRIFFTDLISDYPAGRPQPHKPLTKNVNPKKGTMPNADANAPPVASLYAQSYGYKVCMNKKVSQNQNFEKNKLFQDLLAVEANSDPGQSQQPREETKKKKYATISDK